MSILMSGSDYSLSSHEGRDLLQGYELANILWSGLYCGMVPLSEEKVESRCMALQCLCNGSEVSNPFLLEYKSAVHIHTFFPVST
jgi:hypothetical protein